MNERLGLYICVVGLWKIFEVVSVSLVGCYFLGVVSGDADFKLVKPLNNI